MQQVPREMCEGFERRLEGARVPELQRPGYRKWLRFYIDFCHKYGHSPTSASSLGPFLSKLASKIYRHVLGREFGKLDGVVRAKRHRYVPVVLSRTEVEAVLGQLVPPYRLVGLLLYGCGLRLGECLALRFIALIWTRCC